MAYLHGYSSADTIIKDMATNLTTGDVETPANNAELVYPDTLNDIITGSNQESVAILKFTTKFNNEWVKREEQIVTFDVGEGAYLITLTNAIGGDIRVFVKDKKYNLYYVDENTAPDTIEFRKRTDLGNNILEVNAALTGKTVLIDYEKTSTLEKSYFLELKKPVLNTLNQKNHHFINWRIANTYDEINKPIDIYETNTLQISNYGADGDVSGNIELILNGTESIITSVIADSHKETITVSKTEDAAGTVTVTLDSVNVITVNVNAIDNSSAVYQKIIDYISDPVNNLDTIYSAEISGNLVITRLTPGEYMLVETESDCTVQGEIITINHSTSQQADLDTPEQVAKKIYNNIYNNSTTSTAEINGDTLTIYSIEPGSQEDIVYNDLGTTGLDMVIVNTVDGDLAFGAVEASVASKLSWFKETEAASLIINGWIPIEYYMSFDFNAVNGVLIGDPGLSSSEYISSPFGWGKLTQIESALESDVDGNFYGFSGSFNEPDIYNLENEANPLRKIYGDYTGTGNIDVILAASKSGRPFQALKVAMFGGAEFREKTFNGQSIHTGKHAVSDIVLQDVYENDRGILPNCIAVPRVAKDHGTELIYKRYISGEEEKFIFLNINAPYTPFNTSGDVLIGFAIRMDI